MTGTDVRAGSCGYLLNQQTLNRNSSTPGTLDNFLRNYNVSAENMEFYISNKTQHGWAPGTSFYHGAYNEYVGSRLAQLDEKYQLSLMLETKTLPEKRFVFVKILAIIIPENGAKVSKIKCLRLNQQTLFNSL